MKRLVIICAVVLLAGCDDPMSPNVRLGYYELATRNGEEVPVAVDLPSSDGSIVITSFTYGSVHLLSGGRHATSLGVNVRLGDGSSAKASSISALETRPSRYTT